MPPMTMLGWFHTIMGVIAILTAAYTLYRHRIIRAADAPGRAYLLMTLLVAGSALAIYNQGGFGVGHILAVLTLTALLVGYVFETFAPVGKWSDLSPNRSLYSNGAVSHDSSDYRLSSTFAGGRSLCRFAGCAAGAELSLGVSRICCWAWWRSGCG